MDGARIEFTDPLKSGAELPTHSAVDNSRKILKYNRVKDVHTGRELKQGMHEEEIRMLMDRTDLTNTSLFSYVIREPFIYHSRKLVTIEVEVE